MIGDRHAKFLASRFYSDTVHITPHLPFPKVVNSICTCRAMAYIPVFFCLTDHCVRRRLYFESRYSLTSCQSASSDVSNSSLLYTLAEQSYQQLTDVCQNGMCHV